MVSTNTIQEEAIKTRLDYVEKGIDKQQEALNARLETMNEFREQLKDQNQTFLTRMEYDAKHELLQNKISLMEKLVYIGLGLMMAFEIILRLVMK